ncbi:MAG: pentapeptide repeat-containing protein [Deltaproteobacteria bacterium]|nr:pentapeptide repeat-containing protein [Deltaproteobacteria bacterium]
MEASTANLQAAKFAAVRVDRVDLRRAILDYADLTEAELT